MANNVPQRLDVVPFGDLTASWPFTYSIFFRLPACFTSATSSVGIAERGNGKRRQPIVALMATTLLSLYKTYPLALNSCLLEDDFYVISVNTTA